MKWKQAESTLFGLAKLEDNMTRGADQADSVTGKRRRRKKEEKLVLHCRRWLQIGMRHWDEYAK